MLISDRPLSAPCVCQICGLAESDPSLDGLSYWDDDKSGVLTCRACYDLDQDEMYAGS